VATTEQYLGTRQDLADAPATGPAGVKRRPCKRVLKL
jgi:hypothetical protein